MKTYNFENTTRKLLSLAGIQINGDNPWDIKVNNQEFYPRVLTQSSLGLGEAYMNGWWDCEKLGEFFQACSLPYLRYFRMNFLEDTLLVISDPALC
jgi:hypothetical protein